MKFLKHKDLRGTEVLVKENMRKGFIKSELNRYEPGTCGTQVSCAFL